MRRIQQTLSNATAGAKQTAALPMDIMNRPETALQVVVSGTASWTIQQTLDDPFDATATLNWFDHPDVNLVSQTVSRQGNYAYVPAAVRLVLNSGSGSATITIIQAGING